MASRKRNLEIEVIADTTRASAQLKGLTDTAQKTGAGFSNMAKLATAGFAGIMGAGFVSFLKDAAEAAAEDERAQRQLALALENTHGATGVQIAQTEQWIDKMARATGVADDELRPAMAELARTHGSVTEAQAALNVAMDIAAAKGVSLETVTKAMGKAALGNVGALGRLGVATKDNTGATMSYQQVLDEATRTMGGAAADAADTFAGRMKRIQVATDEAKEEIGNIVITEFAAFAESGADAAQVAGTIAEKLNDMRGATTDAAEAEEGLLRQIAHFVPMAGGILDVLGWVADQTREWGDETVYAQDALDAGIVPGKAFEAVLEGIGEEAESVAAAIKEMVAEQRAAVDPAYAAFKAANDLTKAQDKYTTALKNNGAASDEAAAAALDLVEAEMEAEAAGKAYAEMGGADAVAALTAMLREANVAEESIRAIIAAINSLNSTKVKPPFLLPNGQIGVVQGGVQRFHEGGVVQGPRGQEQLALVKGGETVLPTHDPSWALETRGTGSAGGGGTTIVNFNLSWEDFVRKVRDAGVDIKRLGW